MGLTQPIITLYRKGIGKVLMQQRRIAELEAEAMKKRVRAMRLKFEHPEVLPLPETKVAPTTPGEELALKGPMFRGRLDISRKWSGEPIMSSEGQKRLTKMLEFLHLEKGKANLEEVRLVPMLEKLPGGEPRQFNTTMEKAADLYLKNPEKYSFASTPTGGPPAHHVRVRPGGGTEYQLYNVRSLVPELKREAAKMGQEVKGIEPPVKRVKTVKAPTKEDLAWSSITTIPGESRWWRSVMVSSKGGKSGMKFTGSTADFFKKQYNEFRANPFEYVKKQGRGRMAQKFGVYKDLGLLP